VVTKPQSDDLPPEKRAALRAFADSLPTKHIDLTGAEVARKYDEEAAVRQIDRSVWMTREEAGALIGLPWERIKPLIDRGTLKGLQRGKRWYVERRSAQTYKDRRR
jgi:hypothetical protein